MMRRRSTILVSLLLIALNLAVFGQVVKHEFLNYDDNDYVTENGRVQAGWTKEGLRWAFATELHAHWHPLTWLSHMTDCELLGLRAGLHHLTSLFLHLASSLLLFAFLRRTTGALAPSAFVAALFAVHPLTVESVAWVAERKNVLCTFFWMLTMWVYAGYAERPRLSRFVLLMLVFTLGVMSKLALAILPLVLLLLDYWPLGRLEAGPGPGQAGAEAPETGSRKRRLASPALLILEKVPLLAVAAGAALMTPILRFAQSDPQVTSSRLIERALPDTLASFAGQLLKFLWPADLAVPYLEPGAPAAGLTAAYGLLLVGLSLGALLLGRRHPYLLVGWFWYLLTLVPVIVLLRGGSHALADRHMYIPMVGLLIMAAWGVPALLPDRLPRRRILALVAATVVAISSVLSFGQTRHWRDSVSLFAHTLEVMPDHPAAHNSMGAALAKKGEHEEAFIHFAASLRLEPEDPKALSNAGLALIELRRAGEAVEHFRRALALDPRSAEIQSNLGLALTRAGRLEEAIHHFRRSVGLDPGNAALHSNLGTALARAGVLEDAVFHFGEALRLGPEQAEIRSNLGTALMKLGRVDEAIEELAAAVRLRPSLVEVRYLLGLACLAQGDERRAREEYENLRRLDPRWAERLLTEIEHEGEGTMP